MANTRYSSLIDQDALVHEQVSGRLNAILDVTPEVLPADPPLHDPPNVLLARHVAGSLRNELHRIAAAAADGQSRCTASPPFAHPIPRYDVSPDGVIERMRHFVRTRTAAEAVP